MLLEQILKTPEISMIPLTFFKKDTPKAPFPSIISTLEIFMVPVTSPMHIPVEALLLILNTLEISKLPVTLQSKITP
ncbi:hypothetical protein FACS189459_6110 [Bacilli bacterium]|nr:hypothetical protein FACS189459_6110 [Bacilli bacterium]GHU52017.1 hypothetical protein FACS189496_1420 [Bacilli bacterium]